MDMTQVIFADLNTAHCAFMRVCLHQTVTNSRDFPVSMGLSVAYAKVFFYSALTE